FILIALILSLSPIWANVLNARSLLNSARKSDKSEAMSKLEVLDQLPFTLYLPSPNSGYTLKSGLKTLINQDSVNLPIVYSYGDTKTVDFRIHRAGDLNYTNLYMWQSEPNYIITKDVKKCYDIDGAIHRITELDCAYSFTTPDGTIILSASKSSSYSPVTHYYFQKGQTYLFFQSDSFMKYSQSDVEKLVESLQPTSGTDLKHQYSL
ncbi:hypothetical protein KW794_02000, partial [Candidatus Saccharibacteria bacterium]|nr:hypothetical protein [Candidatus Saccharibacteria bacterium]